jgi:hypothetical protein
MNYRRRRRRRLRSGWKRRRSRVKRRRVVSRDNAWQLNIGNTGNTVNMMVNRTRVIVRCRSGGSPVYF